MKIRLFTAFLTVMALSSAGTESVEGRVVKYPLNVRAGAGTKYTAVAQLDKNNPVEIVAVNPKWLAIKPPANSRLYVQKRYIKNGKLASNVNLRSGPGTGYEAVGLGKRGMALKTFGKATPSGWVAIAPPETGVMFYVGRPAVEADAKLLKKLPGFKAPGGRPLPNEELIQLEGNFTTPGKAVTLTGYLYAEQQHIKALTHVLYKAKGDDLVPECFIMPNRNNLDRFNEKEVTIIGESYKVKNWTMPVLIVKIIRAK